MAELHLKVEVRGRWVSMRFVVFAVLLAVAATACASEAVEVAGSESAEVESSPSIEAGDTNDDADANNDSSATIQEIADPESEIVLEEVFNVDLGALSPNADNYCDAFAAAELLWIEDALVPLQFVIDAWSQIEDVPEEVADDVVAMRTIADQRLEWHLGRIDRDDRPNIDLALAEGLERIADHAVANCDLPLIIGPSVDLD